VAPVGRVIAGGRVAEGGRVAGRGHRRPDGAAPFGVYVHIPFCARRCDYCAFATWVDRSQLMAAYAAACCVEVERAVRNGLPPATSVFCGGGTPSLLAADLLVAILEAIPTAPGAEVTVECNPDTVTAELLVAYREAGVTRLSFGAQSMVPHVLAGLGRGHNPAAVAGAVGRARAAGFDNFNLDLIFGATNESDDDWRRTLDETLALHPPHVSAYALTVEPGTPLAADPTRHPDDDDQAARYLVAERALVNAGLCNYEISNWARPGHECQHNWLYWMQGDFRGIGCAAHSHDQGRRSWNVRTPERYLARISSGQSAEDGSEELNAAGRSAEALQLELRTARGILTQLVGTAGRGAVDELRSLGLIDERGRRLVLTPRGRLLANEVALRLGLVADRAASSLAAEPSRGRRLRAVAAE
jgi:putative oxygen-independent coproporphyrinogen III oxidase